MEEQYYTYTLRYPESMGGDPFYVGYGQRNRIDRHEQEARRGVKSLKCEIIRSIWKQRELVVKKKEAFFKTREAAMKHEYTLINSLPGLTNQTPGNRRVIELSPSEEDKVYFGASIRHFADNRFEYYIAREVASFLGYTSWSNFTKVIQCARKRCEMYHGNVDEHIIKVEKIVETGLNRSTLRSVEDYYLSREAFLFIITCGNSDMVMVSYGKTYMVQQAIRAHSQLIKPDL